LSGEEEAMNDDLFGSLDREVLGWPGMTKERYEGGEGRGGFWVPPFTSYRFGRREIGHVHEGGAADLPFPKAICDRLVADARAVPHGAGFAGVVTYHIRRQEDVPGAVELFRLSYDRAKASSERRQKA
jgi:hypothetical protein